MNSKRQARDGLIIFFAVLIPGSAYFTHKILVLGGSIQNHLGLIVWLVWWVTISSIVARFVLRESPRDISFRWGGWIGTRAMAVATLVPLVVGFVAYGIAWSSGLANFRAPEISHPELGMHFTLAGSPLVRFWQCLGVMLVFGALATCKYAAGEEIGWRAHGSRAHSVCDCALYNVATSAPRQVTTDPMLGRGQLKQSKRSNPASASANGGGNCSAGSNPH